MEFCGDRLVVKTIGLLLPARSICKIEGKIFYNHLYLAPS
jgi:hypothetical protein